MYPWESIDAENDTSLALIKECVKRELMEETGIELNYMTPSDMGYTNDIFYDDKGTPLLEQYPKSINTTGYNPYKLNIGNLIKLYTSEAKNKNYLSALQPEPIFNTYTVQGFGSFMIDTYKFSENITWVFYNDNRNSNTNAFSLFVHNRLLDEIYLKGGIFISRPSNYFDDGFS